MDWAQVTRFLKKNHKNICVDSKNYAEFNDEIRLRKFRKLTQMWFFKVYGALVTYEPPTLSPACSAYDIPRFQNFFIVDKYFCIIRHFVTDINLFSL